MSTMPLCDFSGSSYLLFSENVPALVYYSHFSAIIIALVAGLFILFSNWKGLLNRILFFTTLFVSLWVFLDSIFWASNRSDVIMFVWSLTVLFEPLVHAGGLYLAYAFINKKDISFWVKMIIFALCLPVIVFVPTKYFLPSFDTSVCLANETLFSYYSYLIELLFTAWIIIFAAVKFKKIKDRIKRKEILFFVIGLVLFLVAFSWGAITGSFTEDWNIAQWGLIGIPIFIGILVYNIVRFKSFNIKLLAAQALVATILILIGLQFFFIQNNINRLLTGVTLILVAVFGYYLVRSVKREIKSREEIGKLAEILKNKNAALDKANGRLKELDKQKTDFMSIASHQLRTPLTIFKGYFELLHDGVYGKLSSETSKLLDDLELNNEHLVKLVDEFLDASRLEQGRTQFEFKPADLSALVNEAATELVPKAETKQISIAWDKTITTLPVVMDKEKIYHMIYNFIDNAIKYSEEGEITVMVGKEDGGYAVRVKDSGIGFGRKDGGNFFKKFYRGENVKTSNQVSGNGLGLFICSKFAEGHHGRVWAKSQGPGKGSEFGFWIPFKQA